MKNYDNDKLLIEQFKELNNSMVIDRQLYLLAELVNCGSIPDEYYKACIEKVAITDMPKLKGLIKKTNEEDDW